MFTTTRKSSISRFALILALLGGMLGGSHAEPVRAATLVVTTTNDSGSGSLRQVIGNTVSGDTITFDPLLAGQTITLSSQLDINKNLTIDGSGLSPQVTLSAGNVSRIIQISSAQVTISNLTFTNGSSTNGGAIINAGNLTIINSTFTNNSASGSGGAIYNQNSLLVKNATFFENTAFSGGAIENSNGAVTVVNSTFASNQANLTNGRGGAIENSQPIGFGSMTILNSTFSANGAAYGGGLYYRSSIYGGGGEPFTISNTIIGNSTSGGAVYFDGFTYPPIGDSNLIGNYIPLGYLTDNGGPTQTMALLPGSPAVDGGDDAVCAADPVNNLDQRGSPRPQGSHCDIGAFELVQHTISGNIGLAAATLDYADGLARDVTADANGNYSFTVSDGWSGVVTPYKPGYVFAPDSRAYANVTEDQTNQDYTATATDITFTISGNVGVAGATLSYNDGTDKTVTADENGEYSISVPYNWTGTVTPSKTGYSFVPESIGYFFVLKDYLNQNYSPTQLFTISGNVGVGEAELTYVDGGTKTVLADSNGNYTLSVPSHWSGIVTPSKESYTFTPESRAYTNITADQTSQDYITTQITYTISGNTSIGDVTLTVVNYSGNTTITATIVSDSEGNYTVTVPYRWSSEITPSKDCCTFYPAKRQYFYVQADQANQNFQAFVTISGNAGVSGVTLNYNDGSEKSITSDGSGNYTFTVPYNWTGTVTPNKYGYDFSPANRSYTNLQTSQTAQDYIATLTPVYNISGNAGVPGVTLSYFDGSAKTVTSDSGGNYVLGVLSNWSGTVTPSKTGYIFTPFNRSYTNVTGNLTAQDYLATETFTITGNAGVGGATLSYIDGTNKTVTSDSSGSYIIVVPKNWSGTITPSKPNVTFNPVDRIYTAVKENQTAQDYTATIMVTTIADNGVGSLRQAILDATSGATIKFDPLLAGKTILLTSVISIDKSLTIDGSGLNPRVEISGGDTVKIFAIGWGYGVDNLNVVLRFLVLRNAKGLGTNYSNSGAAILMDFLNTLTVENVSFIANSAAGDGAAIHSAGTVTVLGSEFISNSSQGNSGGGAIYTSATGHLTVKEGIFRNNQAKNGGGAIAFQSGWDITIQDSSFENNTAQWGGAIIVTNSSGTVVTIRNSLFSGNKAASSYGSGGALRSVYDDTLAPNMLIENNTFYANQSAGFGGAISTEKGITLKNNTFSHNYAGKSGASLNTAGSVNTAVNVYNNIFANNTGGGECNNSVTNLNTHGSNNIVEDGSAACVPTIISDPLLGPLADNGDLTQTMALLPGSPAIDAGDNASCTSTDQRGVARPQGAACDIGAFEYVAPPTPTPTNTPTNTPTPTATPPYSYNSLYLSLTSSQTIGGVASADEDILKFDGKNWSLLFDGSDVGVGSPDLFAFSLVDADTILMSFSSNVTVNGISATPQDILQFDATSLGSTTAGRFSMYFDGSDVGFDTTAENIDSVSLLPDGRVLISTTGNPSVSGLNTSKDEDVLVFAPSSLGNITSGVWSMYFDGSDVGLADTNNEDVDALDVTSNGNIYLSTLGDFAVNGIAGADEDVFVCVPTSIGDVTTCNYSASLYFDGSTWGLAANDVDAFNFLSSSTATPTATPTQTATGTSAPPTTSTPTMTPTGVPATLTFSAVADARVVQTSPTTNYGTSTTLQADGDAGAAQTSYIRFETTGINGLIQSAKVRVFCTTNGTNNGPMAYLANSSWTEAGAGGVNWNTQPALISAAFDNKGVIAANSWVEYDVTALVTGNGTYTFALVADSSDGIVFSSREGTTPPQLVLTIAAGGTTPSPAPTATQTPTNPPAGTITPTPTMSPTAASTVSPTSTSTPTATQTPTNPPVITDTPTPTAIVGPSPTPTNTTAASTFTFVPSADSYVDANSPSNNYGTSTTFRVDASPIVRSYLRFEVQGLSGNVTRATLRIFANSASSLGCTASSVSDNTWSETAINYNNAPAIGSALGSSGAFSSGAWITMDVTAYITGNGTYNLGVTTSSSTAISLASRESGANAPQLIIETAP